MNKDLINALSKHLSLVRSELAGELDRYELQSSVDVRVLESGRTISTTLVSLERALDLLKRGRV